MNRLQRQITRVVQKAAVYAAPVVGPTPAALMLRRTVAGRSPELERRIERLVPAGVVSQIGHRYGSGDDEMLNLHRPGERDEPLPIVLWVHGGGWVAGSKDESAPYYRLLASHGYAVAVPHYSLAPAHLHPTPTRQMMQALRYLQDNAEALKLDPRRIVVAGDSAGAHIAAQLALMVTAPGYAERLEISPTIDSSQLRAVVLACGIYDTSLAQPGQPGFSRLLEITLWAYAGSRGYREERFAAMSVADHLTAAFPPVLMTVGNADALAPQTMRFAQRLREAGVEPETVFFSEHHEPPVGHEYQFDVETDAGRAFFDALLGFLARHLGATAPGP